jgi:hypothetical protein
MDIATTLDKEWMKKELVSVLSRRPDLFAKVQNLFWGQGSPYQPGAVFEHFFRIVGGPTNEAGYPMAMIALREEDEIASTLFALENAHLGHVRSLTDPNTTRTPSGLSSV